MSSSKSENNIFKGNISPGFGHSDTNTRENRKIESSIRKIISHLIFEKLVSKNLTGEVELVSYIDEHLVLNLCMRPLSPIDEENLLQTVIFHDLCRDDFVFTATTELKEHNLYSVDMIYLPLVILVN
jgi:hypothetical protein